MSSSLTEVQIHDKTLNEVLDKITESIKEMDKIPKIHRKAKFDDITNDLSRANRIIKLLEVEIRSILPADRNVYKGKLKDHQKRSSDLNAEFTWIKNEDMKGDLKGNAKIDNAKDIRQLDSNQAYQYAENLQNESSSSLDRTLASIDDSTKVGQETAMQLKSQTEQLGRIYDELYEIDDMLVRSTAIISKMLKTTSSDKCIWIFAGLVLIAIILVIVLQKAGPSNWFANQASTAKT